MAADTFAGAPVSGLHPSRPYGLSAPSPNASDVQASDGKNADRNASTLAKHDSSFTNIAANSTPKPTVAPMTDSRPMIFMRKLPRSTGHEALRSMLIFAKDLITAEFVQSDHPEDKGFLAAVACFDTPAGAHEARDRLHGKANAANDANMVVEVLQAGATGGVGVRRNTIDGPATGTSSSSLSTSASTSTGNSAGTISRQTSYSVSSDGSVSNKGGYGGRSRFNGTFQTLEMSPPAPPSTAPSSLGAGDYPNSESMNQIHTLFSPQSPLNHPMFGEQAPPRVSGKSVIIDDACDDETGKLLRDPVAYAKSGQSAAGNAGVHASSTPAAPMPRRTTNPQIPTSQFAGMNLTGAKATPVMSPSSTSMSGYMSSCFRDPIQPSTPAPISSATMPANGAPSISKQGPYHFSMMSPSQDQSHPGQSLGQMPMPFPPSVQQQPAYSYPWHPPVNPADQNPPCNTLYVGNLPIDTSEDELKAMFSKQRGYKRLCFRTKQNGPMCFVEFEDVSFATKALNELYGQPLHNSVKGGIRLSFSKNPLGVRTGQNMASNSYATSPLMNGGGVGGGFGISSPMLAQQQQQQQQQEMNMSSASLPTGVVGGTTTTTTNNSGSIAMPQQTVPVGPFSSVSGPQPGMGMLPSLSTMAMLNGLGAGTVAGAGNGGNGGNDGGVGAGVSGPGVTASAAPAGQGNGMMSPSMPSGSFGSMGGPVSGVSFDGSATSAGVANGRTQSLAGGAGGSGSGSVNANANGNGHGNGHGNGNGNGNGNGHHGSGNGSKGAAYYW